MKGWRWFCPKVEACGLPPSLKNSRACSGVRLLKASGSGGISLMRILVPMTGTKSRGPCVGSGSSRAIGTGMAVVFHTSVDLCPGRLGLVRMDVAGDHAPDGIRHVLLAGLGCASLTVHNADRMRESHDP